MEVLGAAEVVEKLRTLEIKFNDLEGDVLSHGNYFAEIESESEEGRKDAEKLKERVGELENADREYEEKFRVFTLQNNELRDHLNMTIDAVNNITTYLNNVLEQQQQQQQQRDEEVTTNEVTCEEEDEPLTLSQVYDLYQSQPRDEEAWLEMDKMIKAAEEYELRKQQDTIINGLSKDEWEDLLKI